MSVINDIRDPKRRWWEFHKKNKHIYVAFEEMALDMIRRGAKRLSSKMIIEYLRANEYIRTFKTDQYKINNDYTPYYARYFELRNPEYVGIFRKRKTIS